MITKTDLRTLLADCDAMGLPPDLTDDTPVLVDSFVLMWLKHMLGEVHGLEIDPSPADAMAFTSVDAIHDYLRRCHPDRVG